MQIMHLFKDCCYILIIISYDNGVRSRYIYKLQLEYIIIYVHNTTYTEESYIIIISVVNRLGETPGCFPKFSGMYAKIIYYIIYIYLRIDIHGAKVLILIL